MYYWYIPVAAKIKSMLLHTMLKNVRILYPSPSGTEDAAKLLGAGSEVATGMIIEMA